MVIKFVSRLKMAPKVKMQGVDNLLGHSQQVAKMTLDFMHASSGLNPGLFIQLGVLLEF